MSLPDEDDCLRELLLDTQDVGGSKVPVARGELDKILFGLVIAPWAVMVPHSSLEEFGAVKVVMVDREPRMLGVFKPEQLCKSLLLELFELEMLEFLSTKC